MEKNKVVGIGEILWDLLPEGKQLGGAPANFAYHVSQFGLDSCVVSAVGPDALGQAIREQLHHKSVNHLLAEVPFDTGTVNVGLDTAGVPRYTIREQVAWDNLPFTPELDTLARCTRAVCFGSLAQRCPTSRDTIRRFLQAMPEEEGCYKIFDMNLRQSFYTTDILTDSLRLCNVLKLNDEELAIVCRLFGFDEATPQAQCRMLLHTFHLEIVILTCGTQGSHIFTPHIESFFPTPRVTVADTVGAGDSFTAAFCASLLQGKSIPEAHRIAVNVSAYVCTRHGAMPRLDWTMTEE